MMDRMTQEEVRAKLAAADNDPLRIYWRNRLVDAETVKSLLKTVQRAHESGMGFASVTMNQITVHLQELQRRLENP